MPREAAERARSDSGHPPHQPFSGIATAARQLWTLQRRAEGLEDITRQAVSLLRGTLKADYVALAAAAAGQWSVEADDGPRQPLPIELLAEALDCERPLTADAWVVAPLPGPAATEVLAVHGGRVVQEAAGGDVAADAAALLAEMLDAARRGHRLARRIQRLETLLTLSHQWGETRELEPLLVQMAEAATRLLDADRASLFLWDHPTRTLVGRPALGVEGGELRIPDDVGVVGEVVQSGLARRVDESSEPGAIDRSVDEKLGYRTHTLLCVPLRSGRGELFGAFEVINKRSGPFTQEDEAALVELAGQAAVALENAQDRQRLLAVNRQFSEQAAEQVRMIGESPAIAELRETVRRVADTDLTVLIIGENGAGKEVVAQSIHYQSRRRDRPFVAVNCAAIPESLAESELFGHEKGAFTDAKDARRGKFELAQGGTLFLDEIGDLSQAVQAKLLRVLEERVFVRVGGSNPIHTDARLVAATNQDLAEMVRRRQFREDLYFRVNVVALEVPPLRRRADDVALLADHFLRDFCRRARRRVPEFSPAARKRLADHPWPGNVRELRNLMERLAYLHPADRIEADDLAFILSPAGRRSPVEDLDGTLAEATETFQRAAIRRAIEEASGNVSRAAERLGLHRSNLYRKMRQLGMDSPE